ncbi:hypothetical protein PSHT_06990 [Puccinia striiformis]|uniref:Sm protein F n=1 Tax=Puccinia striiformis TaxID=27350 RepID=A0A2S4VAE3_9BASI|nr:hypothetical protein PSHT_10309 [Puccinia striiformis]POW15572.1 hypothetical protein PSHT_06990 [Puccinia striiformis]
MSVVQPVNPKPFLQDLTGKECVVKLKWVGRCVDSFPTLANTEEYQNGQSVGSLGEVFIRCNNVLYASIADNVDNDGDTSQPELPSCLNPPTKYEADRHEPSFPTSGLLRKAVDLNAH